MKKFTRRISIAATSLLAVCWTTSAFSSEPDKAVVRTVYRAEFTPAIAKSVGLLKQISEGDRFAVVQFANGAWGLALLGVGMNPGKLGIWRDDRAIANLFATTMSGFSKRQRIELRGPKNRLSPSID
jgi:hypothetical protein